MKKIYYLQTCSTCKRIISELDLPVDFVYQNIKANPLNKTEIEKLKSLSGSYEALFNKRANLYKELNLREKQLIDEDYKKYLLQHYTFLKRPVVIMGAKIFIGNSKKIVQEIKTALKE